MSQKKNYLDFIEVVRLSDYEGWTAILQKFLTIKKKKTDKILNATWNLNAVRLFFFFTQFKPAKNESRKQKSSK